MAKKKKIKVRELKDGEVKITITTKYPMAGKILRAIIKIVDAEK